MRPDRYGDIAQHVVVLVDGGMVDRHAGIVDGRVQHAEGIALRRPAETVDRARATVGTFAIDLEHGHHLALARFRQHVAVVKPPPGRSVAAEGLSGEARVGARPRTYIEYAHLKDIAGHGATNRDRAGADMDAEAFSGTAAIDRRIDRPGAAPVDVLLLRGPVEHAFRAGIPLDHALAVIRCVLGQRLDRDRVARLYLQHRLQRMAQVAPMHGLVSRPQPVMPAFVACCMRPRLGNGNHGGHWLLRVNRAMAGRRCAHGRRKLRVRGQSA
ncbi:hypothetical protein D3C81_1276290 [compost metagenome]